MFYHGSLFSLFFQFKKLKPAFLVGDRLEAADIKNNNLVCVASVSDIYADKILVHFDGWEDAYDYWCTYNSPHIHPGNVVSEIAINQHASCLMIYRYFYVYNAGYIFSIWLGLKFS